MNMRSYKLVITLILLVGLIPAQKTVAQQEEIYSFDFDHLESGQYDRDMVREALDVSFCKGADEGRFFIEAFQDRGKVLKVKYPKGKVKTNDSGIHTKVFWEETSEELDELYISYWVYFPEDFEFRAGGKLPGLSYQTSERNMSLRLMWRYDGLVETYVHYNTEPSRPDFKASINWSLTDPYTETDGQPMPDQVKFIKGKWHQIELYHKLNTPGENDGIMRGWLDGELALNITNHGDYRQSGEEDIHLNSIYLSTFFGGSDETFQPTKDVYAYFDDFKVSKNRVGDSTDGDNGDANLPPEVAIISPISESVYELGSSIDLIASASDEKDMIQKVNFKINDNYFASDASIPYSKTWTPTASGRYKIAARAFDNSEDHLSKEDFIYVTIKEEIEEHSGCNFDVPLASGLPSIPRISYTELSTIGTDAPEIDNFKKFTLNWNAPANGLYQFAMNTSNGVPDYYVDLRKNSQFNFNDSNPEITINNSEIKGLDGTYWVAKDGENFVMVHKTKKATLYFSNENNTPNCLKTSSDSRVTNGTELKMFPNPVKNSFFINGMDASVYEIVIYSVNSKIVKSVIPDKASSISIDVESLSKGLYFIELKSLGGDSKKYKLVKN